MLVAASMLIWGTQVTALQFFGYGIALAGMVYYKLGYDTLKGYAGEAGRNWGEFGQNRPALRKIIVITAVVMFVFVLLGGVAPAVAPEYTFNAAEYLSTAANKMGVTGA